MRTPTIVRLSEASRRTLGVLAVCAAFVGGACLHGPAHAAAPDTTLVPRLSVPQALEQMKLGKIVLVDVRPLPQRSLGHVRGDLSMPFDAPGAPGALPAGMRAV